MVNPQANESLVTARLVVMPNITGREIVLASRPIVSRIQRNGESRVLPHVASVPNGLRFRRLETFHAARLCHPQGRVPWRLSAEEMRHCHVHDGLALRGGGRTSGNSMPGRAGQ